MVSGWHWSRFTLGRDRFHTLEIRDTLSFISLPADFPKSLVHHPWAQHFGPLSCDAWISKRTISTCPLSSNTFVPSAQSFLEIHRNSQSIHRTTFIALLSLAIPLVLSWHIVTQSAAMHHRTVSAAPPKMRTLPLFVATFRRCQLERNLITIGTFRSELSYKFSGICHCCHNHFRIEGLEHFRFEDLANFIPFFARIFSTYPALFKLPLV